MVIFLPLNEKLYICCVFLQSSSCVHIYLKCKILWQKLNTEICPCKCDPKFALRNITKRGKPGIGIDKHKFSLCLNIWIKILQRTLLYTYLSLYDKKSYDIYEYLHLPLTFLKWTILDQLALSTDEGQLIARRCR